MYDKVKVCKRNGSVVSFTTTRIEMALRNAFLETQNPLAENEALLIKITNKITNDLLNEKNLDDELILDIRDIQDRTELVLYRDGFDEEAKAFSDYRIKKDVKRKEQIKTFLNNDVKITNDAGELELLDIVYLAEMIKRGCKDLDNVNPNELLHYTNNYIYTGITFDEILDLLILASREKIEEEPNYAKVAARFLMMQLHKTCFGKFQNGYIQKNYVEFFKKSLQTGINAKLLNPKMGSLFDLEKLGKALKPERDDLFEYLGLKTLYDRYFINVDKKQIEMPQTFFMRVAMGLSLKEDSPTERAIEFYNMLSTFRFMSSTPTLFNSGTRRSQLSSCYLSTVEDSIDGIFKAYADDAKLSKYAGGLGNDWTPVRASGSHVVGTNGYTNGIVPYLKIANDTALAVNQGGKRKGALCVYLESWHLDIEKFLELRKNTGDDRIRCHDINTANWIPDLFMERVKADAEWTLFSPVDVPELHDLYGEEFKIAYEKREKEFDTGILRGKRISAVDLWRKMLTMLFSTGHAWMCVPGDTKVAVADGRNAVTIKELSDDGGRFPVYSARKNVKENINLEKERYWIEEIKEAQAFPTAKSKHLVEIVLDDDSKFISSPEHLIAMKDGGYKKAMDLEAGESLSSFNSMIPDTSRMNSRFINKIDPNKRQSNMIWDYHNPANKRELGYVVDHIENNGRDNIENLQLLSVEEHNKKTSDERIGENNPFYNKNHSDETKAEMSINRTGRIHSEESKQKMRENRKGKGDNYAYSTDDLIYLGVTIKNSIKEALTSGLWRNLASKYSYVPSLGYITNRFGNWNNYINLVNGNHKIKKVNFLFGDRDYPKGEQLYDLHVEGNNNFYIITSENGHDKSGVLIHNCFKDPCNIRSPQKHTGVVHSSNLCTEITLNTNKKEVAVCNLGSVNLKEHLIKNDKEMVIDKRKLKETIRCAMRMLDNVIDINFYPIPEAKHSNMLHRPVGLGIMGFQDCLYELGINYDSKEAVEFADETMEKVCYFAYDASSDLAGERGKYKSYEGSDWSKGILPHHTYKNLAESGRALIDEVKENMDWAALLRKIKKNGMRNSNCVAIAPTATIANIVGVTASIEPTFQNIFVKSNLSGEFTVINKYLVGELKRLGLWDKKIREDLSYYDGKWDNINYIPEDIKRKFKMVYDIEPTWLIQSGAARQKWIDQAQSLNLYINAPNGKLLHSTYMEAYDRGLKTTYYLRTPSASTRDKSTTRTGALSGVSANVTQAPACNLDGDCESCQ